MSNSTKHLWFGQKPGRTIISYNTAMQKHQILTKNTLDHNCSLNFKKRLTKLTTKKSQGARAKQKQEYSGKRQQRTDWEINGETSKE